MGIEIDEAHMNLKHTLEEERYQANIFLNDRPYRVIDKGDGHCTLIIVDADAFTLCEKGSNPDARSIYVDISLAWNEHLPSLPDWELTLLYSDIHLLMDVFWLEELTIECRIDGLNLKALSSIADNRERQRVIHQNI